MGTFSIKAEAYSSSDTLEDEYETDVWVRYVRRELRGLDNADRELFLGAMNTIFTMDCSKGETKYGDSWQCIDKFTRMHANLAGDPECDHMHDGYGFLTQHSALSMWFELSLQAVDASVSLPYWDYTIDEKAVDEALGDYHVWRKSEIFTEAWFGEANTDVSDGGIVKTSRFGYTPVRLNANNFSSFNNAYGMMRAPWNNNRVPYVTRSNTSYGFDLTDMPGCASHYELLQLANFSDFGKTVMYGPHGTTHLAIGGVWNADWKSYMISWDMNIEQAQEWAIAGFAKQKNMFRAGWLTCPDYCSLDTPESDCKCACDDLDAVFSDDTLSERLNLLFFGEDWYYQSNTGEDLSHEIYTLMCNGYSDTFAVMGDSLETASPNDASFWPTHPAVDRLLAWRRVNHFENEYWPDNAAWSVEGVDTGYCWGHNKEDVLTYTNLFPTNPGPYTNEELWGLLNPYNDTTPYVYDTFEWSHCVDEGYSIDLLTRVGLPDSNVRDADPPASEDPWKLV